MEEVVQPHFEGGPRFWGGAPIGSPRAAAPFRGPDVLLDWEWVVALLEAEPIYWLVTAGDSQCPQARPLWGVWIDNMLNAGTGSPRQKRDLAMNDNVTVHLPSGANVVILEGRFVERHDRELRLRAKEAYSRKYDWPLKLGDEDIGDTVLLVEPRTIVAWTDGGGDLPGKSAPGKRFPATAGKWTFPAFD